MPCRAYRDIRRSLKKVLVYTKFYARKQELYNLIKEGYLELIKWYLKMDGLFFNLYMIAYLKKYRILRTTKSTSEYKYSVIKDTYNL